VRRGFQEEEDDAHEAGSGLPKDAEVKFSKYFDEMRRRPDRAMIRMEWIQQVVENPEKEAVQQDGRIPRWSRVEEMAGRYLRVVLLPDGQTVRYAFFNRGFTP